jgi:hypothetical protein
MDSKHVQDFEAQSGFMDVDRIAWPAIISDLYSGDNSIIATAFGKDLTQVVVENEYYLPHR